MPTISKDQSMNFARSIYENKLWATPEETAAYMETPEGKKMHNLIEELRQKQK